MRSCACRCQPSRGNFYEAGISKALFGRVRVDASYFSRQMRDVADDDLLLNTGVSFPIAFARADIRGTEVKLDVPAWKQRLRVAQLFAPARRRLSADYRRTLSRRRRRGAPELGRAFPDHPGSAAHGPRPRQLFARHPGGLRRQCRMAAVFRSKTSTATREEAIEQFGAASRRSGQLRDRARAPEHVTRSFGGRGARTKRTARVATAGRSPERHGPARRDQFRGTLLGDRCRRTSERRRSPARGILRAPVAR